MDMTFTADQDAMADAVRGLLADICAPKDLRATAEAQPGARSDRWASLSEMGLFGVLAPEAAGGLGLDDVDFVRLALACGHAALPEPLVEQAGIAVPLLVRLEGARAAELLAAAASGTVKLAIGRENKLILGAQDADVLLLEYRGEVHAVNRDAAVLTIHESVDPTRRLASVRFEPSTATRLTDAGTGSLLWKNAQRRGAVYAAAQLCGLADRMLELAVVYSNERKQFGKPIGANQAVKHLLANVAVKIEFARPVIHAAAAFLKSPSTRAGIYASHAKLAAGDAADLAARNSIQVHGAMGYSWEVDLHFYMKRVWALTAAWGDRNSHARYVQSALLDGHIDLGPDQTFAA